MPKDVYKTVGAAIRAARKKRGLVLVALAHECGLNASFLGQVERAERKPSLTTIARIARALDVPTAKLFEASGA